MPSSAPLLTPPSVARLPHPTRKNSPRQSTPLNAEERRHIPEDRSGSKRIEAFHPRKNPAISRATPYLSPPRNSAPPTPVFVFRDFGRRVALHPKTVANTNRRRKPHNTIFINSLLATVFVRKENPAFFYCTSLIPKYSECGGPSRGPESIPDPISLGSQKFKNNGFPNRACERCSSPLVSGLECSFCFPEFP